MNRRRMGIFRGKCAEQGFTLIELLVVVAIIAIGSAIVLPVLLQAADSARKSKERRTSETENAPTYAVTSAPKSRPAPPSGPLPVLDAVDLQMALTSSYHRIGMDVYTRFQVDCTGQIVLRRPEGAKEDRVALTIPFPENTLEARDVELTIRRPDGVLVPLTDVSYTREGIACTCPIGAMEALTAAVRFTALGREQFDYELPPASRLRAVSITLNLSGTEAHTIPDDALQPTASGPTQIRWQFKNLVSDRRITVLIPGAEAPLARVLTLLRLVALGVLLFGAGFWYLSEQAAPGRLDRFRLGHFLLLALTYSLFYVIFAVLGFHGKLSTSVSMLLSMICSLPLLVFHVARVLDLRFALTRVAPLALFTVVVVVNGVYGGDLRDYVFLGAVIVCLAYVTLTYPAWAAGRETYRRNAQAAYLARCQALTERVTTELNGLMAELSGDDARAREFLRDATGADSATVARLERAREPVQGLVETYGDLVKNLTHLPAAPGGEAVFAYDGLYQDLVRKADTLQSRLAPQAANLRAELVAFEAARKPVRTLESSEAMSTFGESPEAGRPDSGIHCLACGHGVPNAPFCQQCGAPQPRVVTCTACSERTVVPIHLLAADRLLHRLFCPRCGKALPPLP